MNDVTHILAAVEQGELQAAGQLLPLVCEELRKLAAHGLCTVLDVGQVGEIQSMVALGHSVVAF